MNPVSTPYQYSFGRQQSLRGIKYHSVRPDLIIIDDLENDENVETKGQRVKLYNWLTKVLMKCGGTAPLFVYQLLLIQS